MRAVHTLGILMLLWGCSQAPSDSPSSAPVLAPARSAPPQVAGAAACVDCHRSQVDDWSRTGMARSLEPTLPGELDGLGPVHDEPAGYHYQFARTPDGGAHVLGELRADDPTHALGVEVLFGIGSGTRDRSYAVGQGAGMWFAPVEVIRRPQGRLAVLAPHASMAPGARFRSPITPECLGCHTDNPPPRSFPLNLRQSPDQWQPRGISCAACHGGAQAHARWQEADLTGEDLQGRDPLLLHGDLNRRQQLSICAACHLQGDARIVLDRDSLGPPAPGTDVLEERALFVARESTSQVGFVSQVERLVQSRCFLESEMTCSTCHNPHRSLEVSGERQRVRDGCAQCHPRENVDGQRRVMRGPQPTASACSREQAGGIETHQTQLYVQVQDCVDCHMPLVGVFDVAEVTIHDHHVRRDTTDARGPSTSDNLRFPEAPDGDWRRFTWPDGESEPLHLNDQGLWLMAYVSGGHLEQALELVDVAPGATSAAIPMYHHVRAGLLEGVGRGVDARQAYERALQLDPELAVSAINLGLLLGQAGDVRRGLDLLDRVVERFPFAWGALRNRAVLRGLLGDVAGARADLERAFGALPGADLALTLAELCARGNDSAGEARWNALARELDPLLTR